MTDWGRALSEASRAASAGRLDRAIAALSAARSDPAAPVEAVRTLAGLYRGAGLNSDARPLLERLSALPGAGVVPAHNLAATLGDMGDAAGSLGAADTALARGGDAPETWLVRARALVSLSRLDEAAEAFEAALARRPDFVEALRDLGQLVWMRGGDPASALAHIDARIAQTGATPRMAIVRSAMARDMLGPREAYAGLRPWLAGTPDPAVLLAAATAATGFDTDLALTHARAAVAARPGENESRKALASLLLASGDAVAALPLIEDCLTRDPFDQYALALQRTGWRLTRDPRALSADDHARLVRAYDLRPPAGSDPLTWLSDAAAALRKLHPFRAEPLGQSVRSGVQAALDPRYAADPAIDAVFRALDAPIRDYIAGMDGLDDPVSARRGSDHEIIGAWSVRLTAGGHHSDHIHPRGWVSSALYIETPEASGTHPHAGWLRFGAASLGPSIRLEPEHWVEPRPGRVVLFPSYLWHGTEPFTGSGERLTIAFDVQPR